MSHRKNLRGAITYAEPKSKEYLDNYDRIFARETKDDESSGPDKRTGPPECKKTRREKPKGDSR